MGRILRTVQTNFTSGELADVLDSRTDVKSYYNGADKLRNCLLVPQGPARRRPGLEHIGILPETLTRITSGITITVPNGGTGSNANDGSASTNVVTTTEIQSVNPYVVVHYDLGSAKLVKFADARGLKITSNTSEEEFRIQYSLDNSAWVDVGTAFDEVNTAIINRRRRADVTARYWRVVRVGTTDLDTDKATLAEFNLWQESGTLSNARCIAFDFSTTQAYMLVASDLNLAVYRDGVLQADIKIPHTSAQLPNINWTQSLDTLLVFHEDVQTHRVERQGAHDEWNDESVTYSNIWTYDFGAGSEATWSATRGWPRCGVFHEGRLWVGGSAQRPSTMWGSKVGSFFDFDDGTAQDDESIEITLDTDEVASIYNITSGRHLQVFASSREFYVLPNSDPITPGSVVAKGTTKVGSKGPGIRTVSIEGATLFIQKGGKGLREFLFTDLEQAYDAQNLGLLSLHLIDSPIDMDIRKSEATDEGDITFLVNNDGTLATMQSLRTQDVTAWSLWHTDGDFKAVGVIDNEIFVSVERTIDDTAVRHIERFSNDFYLDDGLRFTSGLPEDEFTLAHLPSTLVKVRADDSILDDETTDANGDLTIDRDAETEVEIGLAWPDVQELEVARLQAEGLTESNARLLVYNDSAGVGLGNIVWIRDMPLEANLPDGSKVGEMKRIVDVYVNLRNTQALYLRANAGNWQEITFRKFGGDLLDMPPPNFTGQHIERGLFGITRKGQVEIAQRLPAPFEVLGIKKRVSMT